MKAILENITNQTSINAFSFETQYFEFKWHYHPEFELTFITKGKGMRMVGDNYENFEAGDLVLLGSGIQHTWISEPETGKFVSAVVIQFTSEFIKSFIDLKEFMSIRKLLNASSRGLSFEKIKSDNVIYNIKQLPFLNGINQITSLLNILDELSISEKKILASTYFLPKINRDNENRINTIFDYIRQNATSKISLKAAADLIVLTVSAFCKFFKKMTGKTFSDYVNDFRIGNACYMLTETDKTISQIALEVGFENLTYFNRVFLKKKICTPKQYRMQFN